MDLLFNSLSRQGFRTALTISHICGWAGHRLLLKKGNDRVSESRNHVFVQPENWSLDLRHIRLLWHGIWTSALQPLNAFLSSTGFIFQWFKFFFFLNYMFNFVFTYFFPGNDWWWFISTLLFHLRCCTLPLPVSDSSRVQSSPKRPSFDIWCLCDFIKPMCGLRRQWTGTNPAADAYFFLLMLM